MNRKGNTGKAVAAAIIANTIWGFSFMATTLALKHISVMLLLSIRFTFSFVMMLILILLGIGKVSFRNKPLALFLLMGLCEPVIYFITETYGIKYTSSSFSGITLSLIPITTAILSAIIIKEHLPVRRLLWITCSVAGVVLISVNQTGEGIIQAKGAAFLLAAMLSASFFSILCRTTAVHFTSFERTFIMMMLGCIAFTGAAIVENGSDYGGLFITAVQNREVIVPVLFLSVVCSIIAFYCMNYAMTYLEVSRAVTFTNIIPVVSVLAGTVLLKETISPVFLSGIVLILTGLYMVNRISDAAP